MEMDFLLQHKDDVRMLHQFNVWQGLTNMQGLHKRHDTQGLDKIWRGFAGSYQVDWCLMATLTGPQVDLLNFHCIKIRTDDKKFKALIDLRKRRQQSNQPTSYLSVSDITFYALREKLYVARTNKKKLPFNLASSGCWAPVSVQIYKYNFSSSQARVCLKLNTNFN